MLNKTLTTIGVMAVGLFLVPAPRASAQSYPGTMMCADIGPDSQSCNSDDETFCYNLDRGGQAISNQCYIDGETYEDPTDCVAMMWGTDYDWGWTCSNTGM